LSISNRQKNNRISICRFEIDKNVALRARLARKYLLKCNIKSGAVNIPQENTERSNSRPCRIWEIGKKDAKKEYTSLTAAAKAIGYKSATTVHTILKNTIENNPKNKWRGEYLLGRRPSRACGPKKLFYILFFGINHSIFYYILLIILSYLIYLQLM